ncbi:hypothetical protein F5Y07DRAFT_213182 [Xylaria sp. FL0933]|nr:hypothetical protein F5Y07DRAFT_213182 [Xylaria sp. FL0933]
MAELQPPLIIDPQGDLLVFLGNPSSIPAETESSDITEPDPMEVEPIPPEAAPGPEPASSGRGSGGEAAATQQQGTPIPKKYAFKVSSKHLVLASGYFKKMLEGPWKEAITIHEDGLRHCVLENFNEVAVAIVLRVIHGKVLGMSRNLPLELLLEVARVVDYLGCFEVMSFYTFTWVRHIESEIPTKSTVKLLHWICIAAIFRENEIFSRCTRTVMIESRTEIPSLGLPVLAMVSDEINRRRISFLTQIIQTIYNVKESITKKINCSFDCDAYLVGVLTKRLHTISPGCRPQSPFIGLSVASVIQTFNSLPATGRKPRPRPNENNDGLPHCGFKRLIDCLNRYEKNIEGLGCTVAPAAQEGATTGTLAKKRKVRGE